MKKEANQPGVLRDANFPESPLTPGRTVFSSLHIVSGSRILWFPAIFGRNVFRHLGVGSAWGVSRIEGFTHSVRVIFHLVLLKRKVIDVSRVLRHMHRLAIL